MEVSLIRCADYSRDILLRAIRDGLNLIGGIGRFVKPGERILIKPNMLAPKPVERAVTTHPNMVWAVVQLIKEAGATPIVGDSPGLGSLARVAKRSGIGDVLAQTGTELMELKTPRFVDAPLTKRFKRFELAAELEQVDGIINLPKLKTHAQMLLTMGVKNLFGCVPGKRKPQWHLQAGTDRNYFAQMLLDLHHIVRPRLTIMDAIVSMEGNGPGSGDPVHTGFIALSGSAIALDTVCASIVGKDASEVPLIRCARQMGLKGASPEHITIVGERAETLKPDGFSFPPLSHVDFGHSLPYPIKRLVKNALTTRPVIEHGRCTRCGACVSLCPPKMMSRTPERIEIDYDGCIRCYCCQEVCPEDAITIKEGWLRRLLSGL